MLHRCRPWVDFDKFVEAVALYDQSKDDAVNEFEQLFSRYQGVPLSIATNQGRSGIFFALKILGIKKGDEVIVQSFTCRTAINPLLQIGAKVKLVDIDESFNMSVENVRKEITDKTRAIIATHLFGLPCNVEELAEIAKDSGCYLIEDSCQCLGASLNGKRTGSFGDIGIFSFNVDKPMPLGDGGMVTVNNEELIPEANRIRAMYKPVDLRDDLDCIYAILIYNILTDKDIYDHFLSVSFAKDILVYNKKLRNIVNDDIAKKRDFPTFKKDILASVTSSQGIKMKVIDRVRQIFYKQIEQVKGDHILMNAYRAIVGTAQLKTYDESVEIRNRNARRYQQILGGSVSFETPNPGVLVKPAYFRYTVTSRSKCSVAEISRRAAKEGFEIGNYNWPQPIHLLFPYKNLIPHVGDKLKNSEYVSDHIIQLPIHNYVSYEEIQQIGNFLLDQ